MTRFKKELIKRGVQTEETLPYLPFNNIEAIIVHSDTCVVSTYDNRIGWWFVEYGRNLKPLYQWGEDDIHEGWIRKEYIAREV